MEREVDDNLPGKTRSLLVLSIAQLLAMTLWFSASAVLPQLRDEWSLSTGMASWMTMSVQAGFVAGALLSALTNLADRVSARKLFGVSALVGAAANAAIPLSGGGAGFAVAMRFVTGVALAGVYPPGMKLVATWCVEDRGRGIGILVGALTLGSAVPHLLNALPFFGEAGIPPWRPLLLASSGLAVISGMAALLLVRTGPHLSETAPFDWRFAGRVLGHRPTRLANLGYLGHMWELYAMWTWVPLTLLATWESAGWGSTGGRLAGFAAVGVGAIGCVLAGMLADRFGRTTVTITAQTVSGVCALGFGLALAFGSPALLTALALCWGFTVVADSAQYSAAVTELTDSRYVGTALTLQTSLGFLLTLVTIRLLPWLSQQTGEAWAFAALFPGSIVSVVAMARLRRLPEAKRMASGHR